LAVRPYILVSRISDAPHCTLGDESWIKRFDA
jgi:hypothetical protein